MRLRSLLRPPAFTVIGTLALSVGVLTIAFGVAWSALLRPPPFAEPGRLVMLYTTHTDDGAALRTARWSFPRWQLLRRSTNSFANVAAYTGADVSLTGVDATEAARGEFVTSEYFSVLGVHASRGRVFTLAENNVATRTAVVVLSHELWQRRFGGARDVVGRSIGVNGVPHEIIGIMPSGFRGLTDRAQFWLPTAMAPTLTYPEYLTSDQDFISAVARLAPGATVDRATLEMQTVVPRLYAQLPDVEPDPSDRPSGIARSMSAARVHPDVRAALFLLLGAVLLLHLLACANVTSLLLGHSLARSGEFAIRTALGCTSRALVRWRLGEGVLVAAVGGMLGTLLAAWLGAFVSTPLDVWGPRNFYGALGAFATPAFSWVTVAFGLLVTAVTSVAIAIPPALAAARVPLVGGLGDGPRGSSARGISLGRPSSRTIIVAVEMALAVVLCVAGGLMIDSFNRMRRTTLGIDADGVLTFLIQPSDVRVPPAAAPAYIDRMLAAITAIPGVTSATVDGGAPVSGTARSTLLIAGRPPVAASAAPPVLRHYVAPAHFATLGIPVIRGRTFSPRDVAGAPGVAIISETAARKFWPGEDPIGHRVWFGGGSSFDSEQSSAEIVGIVRDVMYEPLDSDPNKSSFYTPYAQFTYGWRYYFVRTTGDPLALIAPIRNAVRAVDPEVPLTEVRSLRSLIGGSWSRQRFDAQFYGAFALLALGLAMSGIYAVVSYAVGQRTREMGIRLALGARPGDVMRLIVRDGLLFPLLGLALGLALALAAGNVLRASLYGVAPTDPRVLGATAVLMLAAAAGACLIPARRATRVDPCEAMRAE